MLHKVAQHVPNKFLSVMNVILKGEFSVVNKSSKFLCSKYFVDLSHSNKFLTLHPDWYLARSLYLPLKTTHKSLESLRDNNANTQQYEKEYLTRIWMEMDSWQASTFELLSYRATLR